MFKEQEPNSSFDAENQRERTVSKDFLKNKACINLSSKQVVLSISRDGAAITLECSPYFCGARTSISCVCHAEYSCICPQ